VALNIGNGFIDRKSFGKSTTRLEGSSNVAKSESANGGKTLTIADLKPGHEFKASVSDVNNNTIKLRLSDGQQISARLDAAGEFNIGDDITFTVKSNDGFTIDITPSKIPTEVNPTLLRALGAADLPATEANLSMVNNMMQEGMPIDKASLQSMHRLVLNNPDAPLQNLIQMTKFNIPVTPENLTQFENYKNFENQISKELSNLSTELTKSLDDMAFATVKDAVTEMTNPELPTLSEGGEALSNALQNAGIAMTDEEMALVANLDINGSAETIQAAVDAIKDGNMPQALEYNEMLIDIALDTGAEEAVVVGVAEEESVTGEAAAQASVQVPGETDANKVQNPVQDPAGNLANENLNVIKDGDSQNTMATSTLDTQNSETINNQAGPQPQGAPESLVASESTIDTTNAEASKNLTGQQMTNPTLAEELSVTQRSDLANALKGIGMSEDLVNAVNAGTITDKELLNEIKDKFNNDKGSIKQILDQALLSNKTYQKVLSNAISKQWFLKPAEVGEEQKVANLYEKLNRQMKQVAEQTANLPTTGNNIMQMASDTSSNMNFMNHLNQMYAYVQIPVKINGEDKQSDLYVFSNRKNMSGGDGEIKALLHLDMDALGPVDAFMKLHDTKLDTKFTLDDDLSYKLFEDHIDELITRLEAKGYNCTVKFEMGNEQIDFVEDFMKQGQSVGVVQRFQFDVRA